jgi:hypothetical protein
MSDALSAPDSKRGRFQRTCLEMLQAREHEPDGLPTSTRFLYYELVQTGVIAKKRDTGKTGRRSDQDVAEAVFRLRVIGLVPWAWIVDETRNIDDWRYARLHRAARASPRGSTPPTRSPSTTSPRWP